ncbi:TonB-dependent receptor [Alteromonas ponticola]|uniref:TonB-dependent receptor n=1 Tax=Alteromonas ponticola TaxID=2720613 RepID=A0ABX1QZ67_9ALTE|nr:TonB-dependent receptor [Alteromonas ponticola]NMH59139.1 TonB-dependent receptor [Alteromonas ponticola]
MPTMSTLTLSTVILLWSLPYAVYSQDLVGNAAAQNERSGQMVVSVTDAVTQRALSNVMLTVTSRAGATYTLITSEDGKARFEDIPAGLYSVVGRLEGYNNVVSDAVRVARSKATALTLELPRTKDEMEVITVTATQSSVNDGQSVASRYMDREMLRSAVGGGSDVMRALDGLPGLASTGDFASFSVRGRGPRDNLIYIDNMPFDKIVHFDASLGETEDVDGGGRFSIFAPNLIRGVEFSPGGWGAGYGGKAGSLLKLDVAAGGPTPSASLRIDLAGYEVGYEGPSGVQKDTTLLFNARQLDFGELFETIDELDIGDPELSDVILKSVTNINANNALEILLLHSTEEYTRTAENVFYSENFEDTELAFNEQDSSLLGVTWKTFFADDSSLATNVYYRVSDKFSSQGEAFPDLVPEGAPFQDYPVREDILTLDEEETELGLRVDFTNYNAIGQFKAGAEIRRFDLQFITRLEDDWIQYTYDQDDFRPDPEQKYIVLQPAFINSDYDENATSYGVYAEQEYRVDNWQYNLGLRYDRDDLSDESLFSPRLNVSYGASSTARYTLSSGVFYQSPSFIDRAADPGNRDLENEQIYHLSVGGNWRLYDHYNLLVEAYYQSLDNLVTDDNRTDGLLTNDGEGDSFGVDVVVDRKFSDSWTGQFTYSYNDATRNDNDGEGDYDADNNRQHVVTVALNWEINERWKIGARWKYFTGVPEDAFIIHGNVLGDGNPLRFSQEYVSNNTERTDDFQQLNVRADYFRTFGPVSVIAFIDIVNVLAASTSGEDEFNPLTGQLVADEEEAIPWLGLKFETSW